jgi:hypothetical protein
MKKTLCILAAFALLSGSAFSQELKTTKRSGAPITTTTTTTTTSSTGAKATPTTGKSIKGNVVSVMSYCAGKGTVLTKEQASDMAKRGEMLGVVVGAAKTGKLYLVCNADGTNAGSKLANGGAITIIGKVMSKGGVNLVTAEQVQ